MENPVNEQNAKPKVSISVIPLDEAALNTFKEFGFQYRLTYRDVREAYELGESKLPETIERICGKDGLCSGRDPAGMLEELKKKAQDPLDSLVYLSIFSMAEKAWEQAAQQIKVPAQLEEFKRKLLTFDEETVTNSFWMMIGAEERQQLVENLLQTSLLPASPTEDQIQEYRQNELPCEQALRAVLQRLPAEPAPVMPKAPPAFLTPSRKPLPPRRTKEEIKRSVDETLKSLTQEMVANTFGPHPMMNVVPIEEAVAELQRTRNNLLDESPDIADCVTVLPRFTWQPPDKFEVAALTTLPAAKVQPAVETDVHPVKDEESRPPANLRINTSLCSPGLTLQLVDGGLAVVRWQGVLGPKSALDPGTPSIIEFQIETQNHNSEFDSLIQQIEERINLFEQACMQNGLSDSAIHELEQVGSKGTITVYQEQVD